MAERDRVDLDRIVDYKAEYSAVIEKHRIMGNRLIGLCPFHRDTTESFTADMTTGLWYCFTEGIGGNFVDFYAKFHAMDTRQAFREICEKYHVEQKKPKERVSRKSQTRDGGGTGGPEPYSLEDYSRDKRLPAEFLERECRCRTDRDRDGTTYLRTSYADETGEEITFRKRYGHKDFRWRKGSAGKIPLYGEWRLPEIRDKGWAVLVEGESDTQSLWYMGFPALGVAGASLFKPEKTAALQGMKIYIHKEPDAGGETFVEKVCRGLQEQGFTGKVFLWSCSALGEKDPSDLFIKRGREEAANIIRGAISNLRPVDLADLLTPEVIPGAPINLRTPEGWLYSDKGISVIDQKTHNPALVCRTPIILTQRLKSIETGDEKMEIAFKRDGKWSTAIFPRSTVFSSRKITDLSDLGCTITSENAKQVVKFLGALEAENIELIPKNDATSTFGWQPGAGRRFMPWHAEGITLDIDRSLKNMAAAYCQSGSLERWIQIMTPHRSRDKFRFILAASFAAPLLRIIKQRIFFVYNWGGSKGGKTAALEAALSAWGNPERLMVNFNATNVGLERAAAFNCDLPLGIDERQLAGTNQAAVEQKIYMIASGKGKTRGDKTGGIQATQEWRTIALSTGEEPLSTETTQTGVSTRTLEIYGGPFDNETEAGEMYQQVAENHGWAGPAYIERLLELQESWIVETYQRMRDYVRGISEGKNGAHIAGIAAVALADAFIDSWFFGGKWEDSWTAAQDMARSILINQVESNATDVNENALQFITDWVLANKEQFKANAIGTCYGFFSDTGNTVYIYPSLLNQALKKEGFSTRKTTKYLADRELIGMEIDPKTKKKQYSVRRWFSNRTTRFVEFRIGEIAEQKDAIDDADELRRQPGSWSAAPTPGGFTDVTEEEDQYELPF